MTSSRLLVAGIDLDDLVEVGLDPVGAGEDAAADRAVAAGDDDLGRGDCLEGLSERDHHVLGHDTGDEKSVGVARRGDEARPVARRVVDRSEGRGDLELAAVARPDVDVTELKRSWEERRWRRSGGEAMGSVTGRANSDRRMERRRTIDEGIMRSDDEMMCYPI